MTDIIDMEEARLESAVRRGFRNWRSQLGEDFHRETLLSDISLKNLALLAEGKGQSPFYLYDLIMNLANLGSGFEFNGLSAQDKLVVMDRYLFVLDRIRFECMKRLGWLQGYPGEENPLVEMIVDFDRLAPSLQAQAPRLEKTHPLYAEYRGVVEKEKEVLIRQLIPKALKEIKDQSSTL